MARADPWCTESVFTRRRLLSLGLTTIAAAALTGCADSAPTMLGAPTTPAEVPPVTPTPTPTPTPTEFVSPIQPRMARPPGTLVGLETGKPVIAWTVDDGTSSKVVERYIEYIKRSGRRITFFPNGSYPAWTEHADQLRPLVKTGQVQLGNHTWSHPDLTTLNSSGVIDQLQRNHDFLQSTYGVDDRPYFRPPFGEHNRAVDAAAASIGYTQPTNWYGTLSDSGWQPSDIVLQQARQWFLADHIVIGHANFDGVTAVFDDIDKLLTERGLTTLTLDDIFAK